MGKTGNGLGKRKELKLSYTKKQSGIHHKKNMSQTNEVNKTIRKEKKKIIGGIGLKIMGAFMIPVILLAMFGYISYKKSSTSIINNYEKSSEDTITAVSSYLELGMKAVSDKAVELVLNDSVMEYYRRKNVKDTVEDAVIYRDLRDEIFVAKETNKFIGNLHLVANVGTSISTVKTPSSDLHSMLLEGKDMKSLLSGATRTLWVGEHIVLDEKLGMNKDSYAMSLFTKMGFSDGVIIIDIPNNTILDSLSQVSSVDGGYLAFITPDGREIYTNDRQPFFYNSRYYEESLNSEDAHGYKYIQWQKVDYLYIYSKVGSNGSMVVSLIPKSVIIEQASEIKELSFVFITIAIFVAVVTGIVMANSISHVVNQLKYSIEKAAKGDLTVDFKLKNKDEFKLLATGLEHMTLGMRTLIEEVMDVTRKVSTSAGELATTSDSMFLASKEISTAIGEIEKGVVAQSEDSEQCLIQMSSLSDEIRVVYESTQSIESIATRTKNIVHDGIGIIGELNQKSKETEEVTGRVILEVENLELQIREIYNFVDMINEIASQTNLLSLNATIEAARAGEHGRGFGVVADEIRKLADGSLTASSQINTIVTSIQSRTRHTVESAKVAETIVKSQSNALKNTIHVFEEINTHVGGLTDRLGQIVTGVKGMEEAKEGTLEAISNISAISEETAAASEEATTTASNQSDAVEALRKASMALEADAKELEESIRKFKI